MQLLPVSYVDLVLGDSWRDDPRLARLLEQGVRVGSRVEVDIDLAPAEVAAALSSYQLACRRVKVALETGDDVGPWVIVERPLYRAVQQAGTKSAQRGDLGAELEALRAEPETLAVVDALLASSLDETILEMLGVETLERDGVRTVVRVRVEGIRDWPPALGGAASGNEIERYFTLSANHAAWRDRMVRRLTRVDVSCVELLADPSCYRVSAATTA